MIIALFVSKLLNQLKLLYGTLSIEAFYFKNHQEIYKAIVFLCIKIKLPIDIFTLSTFLQDNGLIR